MEFKRGHNYPGLLISFDGRDGCGKTTQCVRFAEYLRRENYQVISSKEPGGTIVGDKIRKILLDHDDEPIDSYTELLLFEASRSQSVSEIIKPALKEGRIVCLDRFFDSTTAYQGATGEVSLDLIFYGNRLASHGISPDRTYIFDADQKTIAERIQRNLDRIESKDREFHERVRRAFVGISELESDRVKLIYGNKDPKEIHEEVIRDFAELVKFFGYKKQNPNL